MKSIWLAIVRVVFYVWIRAHGYQIWSTLYRWIWERQYRNVIVPRISIAGLAANLTLYANYWRADGWRQFWDAVSYPGRVASVFAGITSSDQGFDCDEFAIYATHAAPLHLFPQFFTVTWLEGWKPQGHNVCLIVEPYHTPPRWSWFVMDYGIPRGPYDSQGDAARAIVERFAPGCPLVGYAVQGADLAPRIVVRG